VLATACPGCGGPLKPIKKSALKEDVGCFTTGLIFFIITIFLYSQCSSSDTSVDVETPPQPLTRTEEIKKQFSPWDGSHNKLEKHIKLVMNDPDSYNHVSTTYIDRGDHLIVETTFRGKNAFGGVVVQTIKAKANISDGYIYEIIK